MDYHSLPRKDLQLLCKKHGIPANKTNVFMADALAKKRIPLFALSVNREADNDLFSVTPLKVSATKCKGDDGNQALFNNTPFLKRGSKKKEGAPLRSSDGTEAAQVVVSAGVTTRGKGLFQDGGFDPIPETPKEVVTAGLHKSSTAKDLSGTLQREISGKSAKWTTASVKQKLDEKSSVLLKSAAGSLHQSETRRGRKLDTWANGTKAVNEKIDVKPPVATTEAPQQPDGTTRVRASETSAADAELVQEGKDSKISTGRDSTSGIFVQEISDSTSSGSSGIRRSSSENSLTSADEEDLHPKNVENLVTEAGFVSDVHKAQTYLSQDSNTEANQPEESDLERPNTPPKGRYIVKVTFADEVSIMGQDSGGVEKMKLEENMVRRSDVPSTANGGYACKSKLDTKPAANLPFVFRATRQEETKPKRSKSAARETTDLKGRTDSKASAAGALKLDETKARRAASSEVKEAVVFTKGKPEVKASAVPVSSSYSNPSKRPRLGSGSRLAHDSKSIVDKVPSSPTESKVEVADTLDFSVSCSELKILDLPEWAKEFKRKREETLTVTSSVVAHTSVGPANEEVVASLGPDLSPLKKIEERVVELLDRLQGFCWKAVTHETEASNDAAGI